MNAVLVVAGINAAFAGLLAGAEATVTFGVRPALGLLDDGPHLRARQALVRSLRVFVPSLFLPTVLSSIAVLVLGGGSGARWAAIVALLAWTLITFLGTVPVNQAILTWDADAPPADWRARIRRWEPLDLARTVLAALTFALLVAALGG
ncbi:hypothetical protein F4553_006987 [Allocatelliglobosispora scoriae]|uniref:DUF1772 domain-containing protein n=1 Tax=Allocatelliglobosispora scoriae TaxID=643052 RepID=A0A841C343_9ACTN|nr:DUF1772 domain-containing protein [Allocatelliglobosispora scoriae]MBB5873553.1 hypothetical protein [Allocatelliglobosispora scoriae]